MLQIIQRTKNRKSKMKRAIVLLSILFIFNSCNRSKIFDAYVAFENNTWSVNNRPTFYLDVQDTINTHSIYFNVRNSGDYGYANLFILLTIQGPQSKAETQRFEFKLAEADGKWLGSGLGDIYSNQMKMMQSLKFPKKGVYSFTIEQNMRDNPLIGIEDVGVKIVRN